MKSNEFIDFEAQVSDEEESSAGEEEQLLGDANFIGDDLTSGNSSGGYLSGVLPSKKISARTTGLDVLVGQLEDRYLNSPKLQTGKGKEDQTEDQNAFIGVWLGHDWPLWRVKCTARKEYYLVYEIMVRHNVLRDELRSVFFNPRDVGYLYLEARFSKSGLNSLQQVIRGFIDIRMSTLAIVPEVDLKRCLTIPKSEDEQVFVAGRWVQIKYGVYRGDVGLVVDAYHDSDSSQGVKVMVVPRLALTDASAPSSTKRKRTVPRPAPQLLNPQNCIKDALVRHDEHIYGYKSWRFEYGLQVKFYGSGSLSPARDIPLDLFHLFLESKKMAGDNGMIELAPMPLPSFWSFHQGEEVLVHSSNGTRIGTILTPPDDGKRLNPTCVVEIGDEGSHVVLLKNVEKNIILGAFVEVLAGFHAGKKGFVAAKAEELLGICVSHHSTGVDFRVHVNSVMTITPDYANTEVPWLNVEVKLQSGPFSGTAGVVKDVSVTSSRSLSITVRLLQGSECVVGYYAVRERWTNRFLMDHQPLKQHQQLFNVELPWKEVEVTVLSGYFKGCDGIVKNVRRDLKQSISLSLWIPSYRCSIDIDHSAVHEKLTKAPLMVYRPLEGQELREFSINSSIESMRTGRVPWIGMLVDFVAGEYKGQYGAVKDVNRYPVTPGLAKKQSGLVLTVERYTFTTISSTKVVKVDYDAVRYHNSRSRLCDVYLPTEKQTFYLPECDYEKQVLSISSDASPSTSTSDGSVTPLPNSFEKETIFTGAWSPGCPTPAASLFLSLSPGANSPGFVTPVWGFESPAGPSPASPSPRNSSSPPPVPAPTQHWILNAKLVGIPIKVDIHGGNFDSTKKKDGIFVQTVAGDDGISVTYQHAPGKIVRIPYDSVVPFRERPKPATEKGLMVVARNNPEHIGKLVRRIHHIYIDDRKDENHRLFLVTVDRSESKEKTGFEYLEIHAKDLEYVKETAAERKYSTMLLRETREEFSYSPVDVKRYTLD